MAEGDWVPTVSGTLEYGSPQLAQLVFTCSCFTHCTHALHTCMHTFTLRKHFVTMTLAVAMYCFSCVKSI